MAWEVLFHHQFVADFRLLSNAVQDEILVCSRLLKELGPQLGRPRADTLNGSRHANMKELRFDADGGVWRVAFAFDPDRKAILLVCGDKSGTSQARFYRQLIEKADARLDSHLAWVKLEGEKKRHQEKGNK
ncbi:MAG TPA: type II toxin-antitoxin system RelE/ParE family toxin [Candidatus Angelobacter sp.]|jgi:hypothetical protein|nr:type II toxin-antitoxin system RelE/ParE family toxin [Candidatus Angelobacter sp.]